MYGRDASLFIVRQDVLTTIYWDRLISVNNRQEHAGPRTKNRSTAITRIETHRELVSEYVRRGPVATVHNSCVSSKQYVTNLGLINILVFKIQCNKRISEH